MRKQTGGGIPLLAKYAFVNSPVTQNSEVFELGANISPWLIITLQIDDRVAP